MNGMNTGWAAALQEKNMSFDFLDTILNPYLRGPSEHWSFLTSSSIQERRSVLRNGQFIGGAWNNLDLSGLYFDYCWFSRARLDSCNFYEARIKASMADCRFENANFSLVRFQIRDSMRTAFLSCSFTGSVWEKGYSFKHCLFYNCDLTDVVIDTDDPLFGTIFKKCLMSEVVAERLKTLNAVILD